MLSECLKASTPCSPLRLGFSRDGNNVEGRLPVRVLISAVLFIVVLFLTWAPILPVNHF